MADFGSGKSEKPATDREYLQALAKRYTEMHELLVKALDRLDALADPMADTRDKANLDKWIRYHAEAAYFLGDIEKHLNKKK